MSQEYNGIIYSIDEVNCRIVNSHLIRSKEIMTDFCEHVLPDHFKKARSIASYVVEWRAHNLLYDLHLFRSHTQDTDLNINEKKIARFFYAILSLFYRGK